MTIRLVVLIFSFVKLVGGKREGFIVGGSLVGHINQFPHVVCLELTVKGGTSTCGASILTQYILITAAHCLDEVKAVTAYVGNVNREEGSPYQVESYEQHRKWTGDERHNFRYDIALCKLKKPLKLGRKIKRILLMKHPPKAKSAEVAGWGAVEEGFFTESSMLKHTEQKLWTHEQCMEILVEPPLGTVCGGNINSKRDFASKGDSGSGLVIHKHLLVGLVSYKDFALSASLVVYTDTAYYHDWILKTAKRLTCA